MSNLDLRPREPVPAATLTAAIFSALGHDARLSLLTKLGDGHPLSITRLSADTRLTRQAVTKHLRVLEGAGLVASARVGRESQFSVRPDAVAEARDYLATISAQWEDALARLRAYVED